MSSWDDATEMEILIARVKEQDAAIRWLKDCVYEALKLCETVEGAPVRPEVVLDEEWSK